jgi:formate hydrogenlyase transcriptional activator
VRDLVEWKGTIMDVTEQAQAGIELEKAFEEIKRLRDQLHDENVVLREQIDQAFMFEEIVVTSSAFQGVLFRRMKVAPTGSSVLVSGTLGMPNSSLKTAQKRRNEFCRCPAHRGIAFM